VSFVARGGFIPGVTTCSVTATTGCLTLDKVTFPSVLNTGNSITLTGSTSFADTCTTGHCSTSTFPNNHATGGGTYVETNDATGAAISSGTYRIADTDGTAEGLAGVFYDDASGAPASTCSAASGLRVVMVYATLTDSTGNQHVATIDVMTGPLLPPTGYVQTGGTGGDFYMGAVPDTTITC
jgi:hypothetical protein